MNDQTSHGYPLQEDPTHDAQAWGPGQGNPSERAAPGGGGHQFGGTGEGELHPGAGGQAPGLGGQGPGDAGAWSAGSGHRGTDSWSQISPNAAPETGTPDSGNPVEAGEFGDHSESPPPVGLVGDFGPATNTGLTNDRSETAHGAPGIDSRQLAPAIPPAAWTHPAAPEQGASHVAAPAVGIAITPAVGAANSRLSALLSTPATGESLARTKKTEQEYQTRVASLYKRSIKQRTIDPQQPALVSPLDVVKDYMEAAVNHTPASWRLYRAALLWHLASNRDKDPIFEEAYQLLAATRRAPGRQPDPDRDDQQQRPRSEKKTIPEADLAKLLSVLGSMNRTVNWGARVQYWLLAGLSTGARPIEWKNAAWLDGDKLVLCLSTAKRKQAQPLYRVLREGETVHDIERNRPEAIEPGTAHDASTQVRNIPIDPDDTRGRMHIDLHLASLQEFLAENQDKADPFKAYYDMCRRVLWMACQRAFKGRKLYSLYVMRSQFTANKKAVLDLRSVADLLGHGATTRRTMGNYGARRAAHGGQAHAHRDTESASLTQTEAPVAPGPSESADVPGQA